MHKSWVKWQENFNPILARWSGALDNADHQMMQSVTQNCTSFLLHVVNMGTVLQCSTKFYQAYKKPRCYPTKGNVIRIGEM